MPTPKFLPLLLTLSLAAAFVAPPSGAPRRAAVRMTLRLDDDAAGKVSPSNIQMDPALGQLPSRSRRKVVAAVMAGLSAEAAWRQALSAAATAIEEAPSGTSILPPGTIQEIEAGRAVVLNKWLSQEETAALRADQIACLDAGHFKDFQSNIHSGTIMSMPSFYAGGKDGPFGDTSVGDVAVRQSFMARMAVVKAALAKELQARVSLANDMGDQTFDIQYLHYKPGAQVSRHVDDRHVELKRANGSRLQKKPGATRRSITWLVYLNDDWNPNTDGDQLRLHERAQPSTAHVGASEGHLQVGWLRATATEGEQPVFLDPFRGPGGAENNNCVLFTRHAAGNKRDLSREPFANADLRKMGGDAVARELMVDDPADAGRFHLIDAPRRVVSKYLPPPGPAGEDGGERVRDIVPQAGTLVLFDSVSLPHEVLATNRLRYGLQGWFHEKLAY
jgi:hypothetical protein